MKKLTKTTMKILSMCMVLCMLIGVLPAGAAVKEATTGKLSGFFDDFEATTVGDKTTAAWNDLPGTFLASWDVGKYNIWSMQDPVDENNTVLRLYGKKSTVQIYKTNAEFRYRPEVFSLKMYLPTSDVDKLQNYGTEIRLYMGNGGQVLMPFKTAKYGQTVYASLGDGSADIALKYPEDYFDSSLAGKEYTAPADQWIDYSMYLDCVNIDGSNATFEMQVFIDGVCMLPKTTFTYTNFNHTSGTRGYTLNGNDWSCFYIDDVELRLDESFENENQTSYSTSVLDTAPTAEITSGHTGTGVSVENKELNIEFFGATAEGTYPAGCEARGVADGAGLTTNRVMDTTTYKDNITVKAGTNELTEGIHYNVSWNDTKNLKITFTDTLFGNKEYTVSLNENVKNLLGFALDESCREFSFVTEVVEGEIDPPVVGLSTTNNGKRFLPGEEITFEATALSANDIAKVEFYASEVNGKCELPAPYATATEAPYQATVSFAEEGTYEVYAKATDSEGLYDFSSKIRVIVSEEAGIDFDVIPGNDFVLYKMGEQTLQATATSAYGENLSAVTLTLDGNAIANPYNGALEIGNHTLEATVVDSRGTSYTETVNFEYRPEYFVASPYVYNFNNGGADWLANASWYGDWSGGSIEATYESVDAAHGDSLTFTAGNGASSKQYRMNNQNIADVMQYEFEFYVEDLDAQKVNFGALGNASTGVEIGGGRLRNAADNSITYGFVEANKWYKATTLIDWIRGKAIVTVGDMQAITYFTPKGEGHDRMFINFFYVNSWATAGKKMYIDNLTINRSVVAPVIAEIKNINADDTTVSGGYITENTKGFDVSFGTHIYGSSMTGNIKLYQGETEIPVTLTMPSTSLAGREGTLYKSVKVTPADSNFKFEAGKVYSLKFLPGLKAHQKSFASLVFSSYGATSVMTYELTKTATASDIVYEKAAVYSAGKVVDNMNAVVGNKVKFGLTAQSFNSEADNEVLLIIAGYGENEELVSISAKTVTVGTTMDTYYTDEIDVSFCNSVKGFIWDDMTGLEPIGLGVGF